MTITSVVKNTTLLVSAPIARLDFHAKQDYISANVRKSRKPSDKLKIRMQIAEFTRKMQNSRENPRFQAKVADNIKLLGISREYFSPQVKVAARTYILKISGSCI